MNLYGPRNHEAQGQTFLDHMNALTSEDLHTKSDIAAELAHRDIEIAQMQTAFEMTSASQRQLRESLRVENVRLRGIVPQVLEDLNDALCTENEQLKARLEQLDRNIHQPMIARLSALIANRDHVIVEQGTIALIRNCLKRDAAAGQLVRGEILQLLDDTSMYIP